MKLKRTLVFSVVVMLTLVALAAPGVKTFQLKFKGEGDFCADELGRFIPCSEGGDLLKVSHLGLSHVWYEISLIPNSEGSFGPFSITGANGDMLEGYYSDFALDPETGVYVLEWMFTGGTGRFEGAEGIGYTDGLADLLMVPPHAQFEFSGEITVPKGKGKK